jgi:hypothetical protein
MSGHSVFSGGFSAYFLVALWQVRFDLLEIEKVESERGTDFPSAETAPEFSDPKVVSVLENVVGLEQKLPKVNLLKWMWTFSRLPMGLIKASWGC